MTAATGRSVVREDFVDALRAAVRKAEAAGVSRELVLRIIEEECR